MALNNPAALYFDGVDDRVVVPNNAALNFGTGPFSVEMIAIPQNFPAAGKTIALLSKRIIGGPTDGYPGLTLGIDVSKKFILSTNTSIQVAVRSLDTVTLGELYYLAGTRDEQGKLSFYVNGVKNGEAQGAINFDNNGDLWLGDDNRDNYNTPYRGNQFRGYIDNVRIWNRCLSEAEIKAYKDRYLTGTEEGLVAFWRLDEGSGNIAYSSSSTLNGTIYGASWVPGLVDLHLPGEVPISAALCGSSSLSTRSDRVRGLSARLTGKGTATGGEPIRIRGLSANLQGMGTVDVRMNLIAALKARLQGKATLKSNMLVLFVPEGVYVIDADEIFAKDQPSRGQVVANHIEVWMNPLKPKEEPEEVYRSKDPVTIPAGQTQTITIQFDDEPVTEPAVTLEEAGANLSITATKYYAWGADVTIQNSGSTDQACIIVATGRPLEVTGREKVVREDPVSIQENGLKKYEFDNPFVQDRKTAEMIAERLLSYANARRDISIEWRGDPALELADIVMIPEYQRRGLDQRGIFYVTKQELEFDGGLRARLEGRKM